MKTTISGYCPLCEAKLRISRLSCPQCTAEYPFDEELSPFDALNAEQKEFLLTFLKCKGNIKAVGESFGLSYPTVNKRYSELMAALGLQNEKTEKEIMEMCNSANLNRASNLASDIIKNKLYDNHGTAIIRLQQGKSCFIQIADGGNAFISDKLPNYTTEFRVFDIIVDFLKTNGGEAPKGLGRRKEDKVGSGKCGPETVMYQVATQYYGKKDGESTFDPLFVLSAMLEWAGIAENGWGYLKLL